MIIYPVYHMDKTVKLIIVFRLGMKKLDQCTDNNRTRSSDLERDLTRKKFWQPIMKLTEMFRWPLTSLLNNRSDHLREIS